jgi:hypothetical protein
MRMSVFNSFRGGQPYHHAAEGRTSFLAPYTEEWSWGRLDLPDPVRMARSGIARYRLSVYAPGTSDFERYELITAKRWWLGSAAVTLAVELVVASASWGVPVASLGALSGLGVAWYWLARTRSIRHRTRSLTVAVVMIGGPREVIGDPVLFGDCRRQLALVDGHAGAPAMSPVDRETIWAAVYERLDPRNENVHAVE